MKRSLAINHFVRLRRRLRKLALRRFAAMTVDLENPRVMQSWQRLLISSKTQRLRSRGCALDQKLIPHKLGSSVTAKVD